MWADSSFMLLAAGAASSITSVPTWLAILAIVVPFLTAVVGTLLAWLAATRTAERNAAVFRQDEQWRWLRERREKAYATLLERRNQVVVLAALDDFYSRRGLGPAGVRREDVPARDAPRALGEREALRYLRAVEREASARDRVVALLPYYAGLRDGEVVRLDARDVRLSARKGELSVLGKGADGGKRRTVPVHAEPRAVLQAWLLERSSWPGAAATDALLLNRRGGRLGDRSVRTIIGRFGELAGLDDDPLDPFGPHVLRHTFGTQLVRAGVDLVTVAELMGHARLETTRIYTRPTKADRERALDVLLVDH